MRDETRQKLQSYRDGDGQRGSDGQIHVIDAVTRIPWELSERLAELHETTRPDLSLETGLAYGFSTLPILDAMDLHRYGHHIAVDPSQNGDLWHGIAVTAVEELHLGSRFTLVEQASDQALVAMIQAGRRLQFAFLDGVKTLDGVLTDFFLVDQLLDEGGVFVLNDMWIAPGRAARSFFRTNLAHYREIPSVHENIFVMRKTGRDARVWNHFQAFDASGEDRRPGFLARLLGGR